MPKTKSSNRLATAKAILLGGKEIIPCSAYKSSYKEYKVLEGKSKKYREYIRRSLSGYDVSGIPARSLSAL
jgi:hypothetical protein